MVSNARFRGPPAREAVKTPTQSLPTPDVPVTQWLACRSYIISDPRDNMARNAKVEGSTPSRNNQFLHRWRPVVLSPQCGQSVAVAWFSSALPPPIEEGDAVDPAQLPGRSCDAIVGECLPLGVANRNSRLPEIFDAHFPPESHIAPTNAPFRFLPFIVIPSTRANSRPHLVLLFSSP